MFSVKYVNEVILRQTLLIKNIISKSLKKVSFFKVLIERCSRKVILKKKQKKAFRSKTLIRKVRVLVFKEWPNEAFWSIHFYGYLNPKLAG